MKNHNLSLVASVFCFSITAIVLVVWFSEQASIESTGIIPVYAVILCSMGILAFVGKRWLTVKYPDTSVWLHPPLLITIWWMFAYILPGMVRFIIKGNMFFNENMIDIQPSFTILGTVLTLVGLIFMWAGYIFGLHLWPTIPFLKYLGKRDVTPSAAIPFYIVAIIVQLVQISRVGIDYGRQTAPLGTTTTITQGLGYFQNISYLVFTIALIKTLQGKWPRTPLLIITIINIGLGFMSGFMKPILWLGLIFILVVLNNRLSIKRFVIPLILLLLLCIIIVPVAENIRYRVDNKQYDMGDLASNIETTVQVVVATSNKGLIDSINITVDRFLYRQALIAYTPGIIIQRTPSYFPYQGIGQLLLFPAYIIPRGLWPGKPNLSRGNWFAINYLNQPASTLSSAAMTLFGDGYIYSGWLGTVLGCFIIGCLGAFLYRNLATTGLIPIFMILLLLIIDVEGQFAGTFTATVQSSVIYILAYSLMALFSHQGWGARNTPAGNPSWAHPKVMR